MKMISTSDLLSLVNSPVTWNEKEFLFLDECRRTRCKFKMLDDSTIELSGTNDLGWGLTFDWGDKNYLRDFLLKLKHDGKEIIKDECFLEKQESIPRLQDDYRLLTELDEEVNTSGLTGLWERGYSPLCAFVCFRGIINHGGMDSTLFQKGILTAIDMSYMTFCTWRGWTSGNGHIRVYDLDEDVKLLADIVRNETIRKIYYWMKEFYETDFVEGCFSRALSDDWRTSTRIEIL